jgi:hypothetical protein
MKYSLHIRSIRNKTFLAHLLIKSTSELHKSCPSTRLMGLFVIRARSHSVRCNKSQFIKTRFCFPVCCLCVCIHVSLSLLDVEKLRATLIKRDLVARQIINSNEAKCISPRALSDTQQVLKHFILIKFCARGSMCVEVAPGNGVFNHEFFVGFVNLYHFSRFS